MISITCSRANWLMLARAGLRIAISTLLIGFAGATLVRLGPGFGFDERELDTRYSTATKHVLRAQSGEDRNIGAFYVRYLGRLFQGDLGVSRSFHQPVTQLLAERLPVTLVSLAYGCGGGVLAGLLLALVTVIWRVPACDISASMLTGICLSAPSAVIALLLLWVGASGRWAIALVVFPYVYRYSKNLFVSTYAAPHVLTALGKGVGRLRIVLAHVLVPVLPQLAAIAAISFGLAFGASIPIEAVSDVPGIGQLAWQAALGRDVPLLVGITLLVALITLVLNSLADLGAEAGDAQ
jgi:peptide/nickel transport system permease protein